MQKIVGCSYIEGRWKL